MQAHDQVHIWDTLMTAGADLGLKPFGLRALNALRLEKGFGSWAREYRPIYDAYESGLGRFVALKKEADFIGKAAAAKQKAEGGSNAQPVDAFKNTHGGVSASNSRCCVQAPWAARLPLAQVHGLPYGHRR